MRANKSNRKRQVAMLIAIALLSFSAVTLAGPTNGEFMCCWSGKER